jgi:multiple sugar transport system substrate-binding protein
MKNAWKVLTLIIVAMLAISGFTGCKSIDPGNGTSTVEESTQEAQIDTTRDLGGYQFVLASHWAGGFTPEKGSSTMADAMWKRYDEIQQQNNCTIEFKGGTPQEYITNLDTAAAAGIKYADVVLTNLWWYRGQQDAGYFVPWNDVISIDLNDSKWTQTSKMIATEVDGKIYGIDFSSWETRMPGVSNTVFFNKNLLAANNQPDPYDLFDQGEWTWEKFREMAKAMSIDEDGDKQNDIWGVTSIDRALEYTVIKSNGAQELVKDENGNYSVGFNTPAAFRAMEFVRELISVDKTFLNLHDVRGTGDWRDPFVRFKEGKVAFFVYSTAALTFPEWLETMEDDYGLICFPQGPDLVDKAYYGGEFGGDEQVFCMTLGAEDVDKAGYILNRITEPLEGKTLNSWKDYTKKRFLRNDEKAFEHYERIYETAKFNNGPMIGAANFDLLRDAVFTVTRDQTKTPAEAMEGAAAPINELLNEIYNNN